MADARLALARALAPDPNYTYGNILPLAKNNTTGALSPAMPGVVRSGLQGLADLVNMRTAPSAQPGVNTLTPDALGALMGMPAGGVAPAGAVATGAVRRAALPMDEASRMARAAEQGYDVDKTWYRGDFPNLSRFGADSGSQSVPGNIFLSSNERLAGRYAKTGRPYDMMNPPKSEGDGVYSLLARRGNSLEIDAGGNDWLEVPTSATKAISNHFPTGVGQTDRVAEAARKEGFDSLLVRDVLDQHGDGNQLVIFNPANIRSRFAAFDPAKKDSADLLASRSPGYPLAWQQQDLPDRKKLARALSKVQK